MSSACVNSSPLISWLGPTVSFDSDTSSSSLPVADAEIPAHNTPEMTDLPDFEFRLDDPVSMLPADELFSQGKLVPLQMAAALRSLTDSTAETRSSEPVIPQRRSEISGSVDPYLFSPKAPRCSSSRWREFWGLRKLQNLRSEGEKLTTTTSRTPNPRSIRLLLNRNTTKSSESSLLNLPLLRDSDDSISLSSRLSLSSTSSDSSDLPRLSLDSEKLNQASVRAGSQRIGVGGGGPTRVRVSRPVRRVSADAESPRMNSSGKVVFDGGSLERSSSSPAGSFNGGGGGGGGSRVRRRGMERSYSANMVRVNSVLNMPVCNSLRGVSGKPGSVFGFFCSEKRKEKDSSSSNNGKTKAECKFVCK